MAGTTASYPSLEKIAVGWVRATSGLTDLLGVPPDTRCATRFPSDPFDGETKAFLRVFQVYAAPLHEGQEIIQGLMQWDAIAARGDATPDYATAEACALALMKASRDAAGTVVGGEGTILSHVWRTGRRVEEPETGWARFLIETALIVRA